MLNIVFIRLIIALTTLSSPLLRTQATTANYSPASMVVKHDRAGVISIGSILDQDSRSGKEAKLAMEMAVHDFSSTGNQRVLLHFRNSQSKPVRAALAANDLIATEGVRAILGAHTWEEGSAIADADNEATHDVPVFLSLCDSSPTLPTTFPFLLQASPSQHVQMKAIAKIIQSSGVHEVTLIYENAPSISSHELVVNHLLQAFHETGAKLSNIFSLRVYTLNSLDEELNLLKKQKQKVFVIHTSLDSGYLLYQNAKKLNMTGEGYIWIATNSITDLLHSVSPNQMSLLQGLIGTKTYFPENSMEFQDFRRKFRPKFRTSYADEEYAEPGIFAAEAYDAMRASLTQTNTGDFFSTISASNFKGLSGKFQFINRKRAPAEVVEIVSVTGKSYQSGYWTVGLGFSKTTDDDASYHASMETLKTVLWPAQPWYTQKRQRVLAETSKTIRVGVPAHSFYKQYVIVTTDPITNQTTFDGFSIKVFEEAMKLVSVNNSLTYKYFPFSGNYTDLVKQIALGEFDAVAGDITILGERYEYADFTEPYTETVMVLIVPVRSRLPSRMWLFLKPFTKEMWGLIVVITIYNGFTVWLIERKETNIYSSGTVWHQIVIIFWLSFTTLFSLQGKKLHSTLSRMTMVVWLFMALIITQTYTASLASMLTAQILEPTVKDVETLKRINATVGYCKGSFVKSYLVTALNFSPANINYYGSPQEYAEALNSREIAGIFLDLPSANIFLAQYCKGFTKTGKTFKLGGFGFAFQKNFSLLPQINKALMNITESGKLLELEDNYIHSTKCLDAESLSNEDVSIGINSFSVLFGLSVFTSTVCLALYVINLLNSRPEHGNLFKLISVFIKKWRHHNRQSSGRIMDAENPDPSDTFHQEIRQSSSSVHDPHPRDFPRQGLRQSSFRRNIAENTRTPDAPHQDIRQSSGRSNYVNTNPHYAPYQERTRIFWSSM